MKKKAVHFDSTIPSYLFDERETIRFLCELTRKWWDEGKNNYEIFVSPETVVELNSGNYPRKSEIMEFVQNLEQLEPSPEIVEIANYYIKNQLMPEDIQGDAAHLAYASFYNRTFAKMFMVSRKGAKNAKKIQNTFADFASLREIMAVA